jgi:hypothetical protein
VPSFDTISVRDVRTVRTIRLRNPETGAEADLEIKFYASRVTMAAMQAASAIGGEGVSLKPGATVDETLSQVARIEGVMQSLQRFLCRVVAEWDLTGPLLDIDGNELVAPGQPIPLRPEFVAHIDDWIVNQVIEQIKLPKPTGSPAPPAP